MNAHLTLRKMSNRTSSGGRNVKLLQDMCLDTLSVRAVLDCFCNISLPPRLADYYYERVRKQHGITDEVLPVWESALTSSAPERQLALVQRATDAAQARGLLDEGG
ncbi:uncharacterized protein LOC144138254 isoform X1 [Haemaphysalis longicornis]